MLPSYDLIRMINKLTHENRKIASRTAKEMLPLISFDFNLFSKFGENATARFITAIGVVQPEVNQSPNSRKVSK